MTVFGCLKCKSKNCGQWASVERWGKYYLVAFSPCSTKTNWNVKVFFEVSLPNISGFPLSLLVNLHIWNTIIQILTPPFLSLLVKNLAEAEYSVALYMYMRLLGYPSDRISILTTYNGQKHLIRDVINQRCAGNPFFGQPNKVRTQWTVHTAASNDCIIVFVHFH